ncbi:MAG: Zinc-containing alcohol dehydrogenase superfamily [Rhodospirillales bacterium]|nr:Zinc-containing alcohol dehydrogenase superfamily [Rhodospirillales bacterium]
MHRLRIAAKAADIDHLELTLEPWVPTPVGPDQIVIEIRAAGVNPSDVKACFGLMPHAVWPRTPGRDWAGVVTQGPADLIGREVWGSGGRMGIERDGSHASHIVVPRDQVRLKPKALSLIEAGAVGVPFVTAYEGLRRAGLPRPGESVLVMGANGRVGQAALQIAAMRGAQVFGVSRRAEPFRGPAHVPVRMIDASAEDVAAVVRAETGGRGADLVYNTVGSPYFETANQALAVKGRQILISTIDRAVPFDIFAFYRGAHTYVGIDSLALTDVECAQILALLTPGFESGALAAFPVAPEDAYPLTRAKEAYRCVLAGAPGRVVLVP